MHINQLDEFVVLAKHLNFSKAADELSLTQSALSKRIAAMERELGFELVRRTKPLRLTTDGERFLLCAQETSNVWHRELAKCQHATAAPSVLSLLWFDFGVFYEEFLASLKDIPFTMALATGNQTYFSELESGQVDIETTFDISANPALMEEARRRGIAVEPIGSERGAILVMGDHPLASKEALAREDLRGASVLMPDRGTYNHWRSCLEATLGAGLDLNYILLPMDANLSNLTYQDFGNMVYITLDSTISRIARARNDVVMWNELDGRPLELPLALFYRFDNENPNIDRFVEAAHAFFDEA